ncbi:MAG TPA: hypothetical protein VHL53_13110 [Acidimicrobiia bacterium]|nr:hypothetical protein [Acidimicrobiia bacterium]
MAWSDTQTHVRDIVLLILGTLVVVHELLFATGERPLILGAGLSCLGLPLVSGLKS